MGKQNFSLRLARKNRIHRLLSTRAKTVLEVRLAAAGRAVERLWARQAEGLRGNGGVTKCSFFTFIFHAVSTARRRSSWRRSAPFAAWTSRRRSSPVEINQ